MSLWRKQSNRSTGYWGVERNKGENRGEHLGDGLTSRKKGHWSWEYVLIRVTIAVLKHHDQKQPGEKRVYLTYMFWAHWGKLSRNSKTGRNLEIGVDAEAMEDCIWLAPHGLLRAPKTTCLRIAWARFPESITNLKTCPTGLPMAELIKQGISHLRFCSLEWLQLVSSQHDSDYLGMLGSINWQLHKL